MSIRTLDCADGIPSVQQGYGGRKPDLIKRCSCPIFILSLTHSVTQDKLHQAPAEQPANAPAPPPAPQISSEERKQRWEAGQMDYMGEDSFDNIERKLDSFLK